MKNLQFQAENRTFLSNIKTFCLKGTTLAIALICLFGCEKEKSSTEAFNKEAEVVEKQSTESSSKELKVVEKQSTEASTNESKVVEKPLPQLVVSNRMESAKSEVHTKYAYVNRLDKSEKNFKDFGIKFSERPDEKSILNYVTVTPSPGRLTVTRDTNYYWWDDCYYKFHGEFKPRTKYTLTIRAGMPFNGGKVLEEDHKYTWTMDDYDKSVDFVSNGRYLPPAGNRNVLVRTMNISNLLCEVSKVPAHNIVQMLAREEKKYKDYYGSKADNKNTQEIAEKVFSYTLDLDNHLNEPCETPVPIRSKEGKLANGVYLLGVFDPSYNRSTTSFWWYETMREDWKLVCVTDIGLSVRQDSGCVYIWATSLTKGTPMKGLRIKVYGSNNILVTEGVTDNDGWCCCENPDEGEIFAIVASTEDDSDTSFLALSTSIDEAGRFGSRKDFLKDDETEAFVWTDRGIYRHNEPILVHSIIRNGKGKAPASMPVTVTLSDPRGKIYESRTIVTDEYGAISCSDFTVPDDQWSGKWKLEVKIPGDGEEILGSRTIIIEEFVPPQIRVKIESPREIFCATNTLKFSVVGEHLFGGPAKGLTADGAFMFKDEPFAPKGWEGYRFGDASRRLRPNFCPIKKIDTDANGRATFFVPLNLGLSKPSAAVKMYMQGSIFEAGGRAATARATSIIHYYPFYIGVELPEALTENSAPHMCRVAIVNSDGTVHKGALTLKASFESVERVYGLRKDKDGMWEWHSEEVRCPLGAEEEIKVSEEGVAELKVPINIAGDFAVRLFEEKSGVSFSALYCVNGKDDPYVRTALENPSRVTLAADKNVYYPGERPKITVKSPFPGYAWINVLRRDVIYSQVVVLTNATSEIILEPVKKEWKPSVDLAISVVQASRAGQRKGMMNRAYGLLPLRISTHDSELDVKVKANVVCAPSGGSRVTVDVDTKNQYASGDTAVVTLTDEGIHILTDEKIPDPIMWFGCMRKSLTSLYDIYNRLLPIVDDKLKRADAKTGGGNEGDLFRRMSPVPSRRFKPLSIWEKEVKLKDGHATVKFTLPEFVGEVRVTAIAYNKRATGASAVQAKVVPNLVMQPDAPRFVAPGDTFLATATFSNRSEKDDSFVYELSTSGSVELISKACGEIKLSKGESKTLTFPVKAKELPGEGNLRFKSVGMGEKHINEINLPVRPIAPWSKSVATACVKPGESMTFTNSADYMAQFSHRTFIASDNPVTELASALEYLIEYPYGCLEQTTAQVFPLITSGGILNTLLVNKPSAVNNAKKVVDAGIRRVCSMIRESDFVMWPDCNYAPWDKNVSLWASHFLIEAQKNGFAVQSDYISRVNGFLRKWSMSTNETVSIYALHNLSLAGSPNSDRMLTWYDKRDKLSELDLARLSRAFRNAGDPERARELLVNIHPEGLKASSFTLLALLELDPSDERIIPLVVKILEMRDKKHCHWETTASNAHALLALGAYYRTIPTVASGKAKLSVTANGKTEDLPIKELKAFTGDGDIVITNDGDGMAYISASTLALTNPKNVKAVTNEISVTRKFLYTNSEKADLSKLRRGDLVVVQINVSGKKGKFYSDLVIEDLLPSCFEAVELPEKYKNTDAWFLRQEMRDDRVISFSKDFYMPKNGIDFYYAVRVVSAGDFVVPGTSVEAMYEPDICSRISATQIKIEK